MTDCRGVLLWMLQLGAPVPLQLPSGFARERPHPAGSIRDGQHEFDFNLGTWKTRISRLQHPLTGSKSRVDMEGTVTVRPVWGGRAQLEEIEADGPTGRGIHKTQS
jgi:hypothetical protein